MVKNRTQKYDNIALPHTFTKQLIDPMIKTGLFVSRADVVKTAMREFAQKHNIQTEIEVPV